MLRAGYGVSALPWPSSYGQDYPVRQTQQFTGINGFAPAGVAGDRHADAGVRGHSGQRHPRRDALRAEKPWRSADRSVRGAAALVERRLSAQPCRGGFTAEMAYVGNRGAHILQSIDLNAGYTLGADEAGPAASREIRAHRGEHDDPFR